MKLVELLKEKQNYALRILFFDLEEKERFAELEKASENGVLFVIVHEQIDWKDNIFDFSKEMPLKEALKEIRSIKKKTSEQGSYSIYNESLCGFSCAANDVDIHEYSIKMSMRANNFANNLYKIGALDGTPQNGWIRQLYLA